MKHKSESQYDGFLDLDIRSDGTYIIVYAPNDGGKRVTLEDAVIFLKKREIETYDYEALKAAIESNSEREVRNIAVNSSLSSSSSSDEKMTVEISKNKMFSVICFKEPLAGGKLLTKEEILETLKAQGIVYGIDLNGLNEILADKKYNYKYLIAKGLEVKNGTNGSLKFNFDVEKKNIKPKIAEDGSVDFRNLDLIEMVKEGQVLVTAIPPEEGNPGRNIFGKELLNAKGKKVVLPKGKNVKISNDGNSLIAAMDGQITYMDGKISIYSTFDVPANVDNSTGNIEFIGNVVIKGNVLTGFSVKAGGSIEVYGVVEGAEIEADGNIILYRGMQGMNKGTLNAGGDITAKYIENSSINAHGDIQSNAIMHSEVKCGGSILVEGKKGLLVGGVIRAGREIVAKNIGSPMATITEIEVGTDPEILENYKNLKSESENIKEEVHKMTQLIETLTQMKNTGKLPNDKEEMLFKSIKTKTFMQSKLESVQKEVDIFETKLQDRADGRIKVHNIVYPGVKITIGNVVTYVREEQKFCTIVSEHAEIKYYPYA